MNLAADVSQSNDKPSPLTHTPSVPPVMVVMAVMTVYGMAAVRSINRDLMNLGTAASKACAREINLKEP